MHNYAYLARKALNGYHTRLKDVVWDVAFVLQVRLCVWGGRGGKLRLLACRQQAERCDSAPCTHSCLLAVAAQRASPMSFACLPSRPRCQHGPCLPAMHRAMRRMSCRSRCWVAAGCIGPIWLWCVAWGEGGRVSVREEGGALWGVPCRV